MDDFIKEIKYDQEVRNKILKGVTEVYRVVSTTLGSKGRNVLIERNWGAPVIIHDGVTAARAVILKDYWANQAAQLVIKAAQDTNNQAGDGTTTATILTYAIYKEAHQVVSAGNNPAELRKGIEKSVTAIIDELKRIKMPVESSEQMIQIASISAADKEMGKLIAGAIQKVGKNGVVSVQEGASSTIEVEYKEGMEFDRGLISPYLLTDTDKMEGTYDSETVVVVLDDTLNLQTLVTILKKIYEGDKSKPPVLFICNDYEPDASGNIIINKLKFGVKVMAVKSPEFGPHRTNILSDIAVLTGGMVFGGNTGLKVEELNYELLGKCDKVVSSLEQTMIIGGKGKESDIKSRIVGLKKQKDEAKDPGLKDKVETRIAKLTGGVAVIAVGASSEAEIREIKERVIDAVNATRAAVEEGVVPGGGVALIRASKALSKLKLPDKEMVGVNIVKEALFYPMKKLVANAGAAKPDYIVGKILDDDQQNVGYNVDTESFENMLDSGIIDPVKVTRSALQNAASTAIMLMTTDVMIVFDRESNKKEEDKTLGIAGI